MPGDLKGALQDLLQRPEERPSLPSPIAPPKGAKTTAATPGGSVPIRLTLLVLVAFAVIVFIAIRPILPFASSNVAAKMAVFDNAAVDEINDYRDPLFQPFAE